MNAEIANTIKHIVKAVLPDARILLFGSQAKGNADSHSDYDLLIITPGLSTQKEKLSRSSSLRKAIIRALHAPVDLFIYSESEILEKQVSPGAHCSFSDKGGKNVMTAAWKEYIYAWMLKAAHDLMSMERLMEEPMILDSACFHCQQAIEKSLKAFLYYHGKDIKKTHEIDFLLNECAVFDPVFATIDSLSISDYAVQGRYPDLGLMPDVAEVKLYYKLAVQVNELVKQKIVFSE